MRERVVVQDYTKDVWSAYAALDIVCVPSVEPEPFALVAIEAMAMGKPVVAGIEVGRAARNRDGVTGITFAPRDPEALATAIGTLLADGNLRRCMGEADRKRDEAEFLLQYMYHRFAAIWTEITSKWH